MQTKANEWDVQPDVGLKTSGEKAKLIVAAGFGNFLEIFDFTVYSFFAAVIGVVFFKAEDPMVSLMISVSVFGVGFIMRPLGSILIGTYADRKGRKAAMLLTIVLMALGSAVIGFAPSYDAIGIAAPILIVVGRLMQGFSAGGEIGAATTLLMESAGYRQRGFFVSWQFIGQGLATLCGALLGALLTAILSTEQLHSWGWRIPFILSLAIIPVGLYIRAHIEETFVGVDHDKEGAAHNPIKTLLTQHTLQFFLGVLLIVPSTVMVYSLVYYMPNYLKAVTTIDPSIAFLISAIICVVWIIFSLLAGFVCDRIEKRKFFALGILAVGFVSSYLAFRFVHEFPIFIVSLCVGAAALGAFMTTNLLVIMEAFPRDLRATATAVIYAVGVTIFGGTAQMIVTQLLIWSHNNPMAPFWYLGSAIVVGGIAFSLFREDRHV